MGIYEINSALSIFTLHIRYLFAPNVLHVIVRGGRQREMQSKTSKACVRHKNLSNTTEFRRFLRNRAACSAECARKFSVRSPGVRIHTLLSKSQSESTLVSKHGLCLQCGTLDLQAPRGLKFLTWCWLPSVAKRPNLKLSITRCEDWEPGKKQDIPSVGLWPATLSVWCSAPTLWKQ